MKKQATYKLCPACNYFCSSEEESAFCPFCGEKLISKCIKCEDVITTPYANFCSKCGTAYPGRKTTKK